MAAGHEHSLQVHRDLMGMYYAVSGAGSSKKVDRVDAKYPTALMAEAVPGFMRLDAHEDGSLSLKVYGVRGSKLRPLPGEFLERGPKTETLYQACLAHGPLPERVGFGQGNRQEGTR